MADDLSNTAADASVESTLDAASPYDPHGGVPTAVDADGWATLSTEAWLGILIASLVLLTVGALWLGLIAPGVRLRRRASRVGCDLSLGRAVWLALAAGDETDRTVHLLSRLRQAGIDEVTFDGLRAHRRAGGHVSDVVDALIHARRCGVRFDLAALCRFDLAGEDPTPIVDRAVRPWRLAIPGDLLGGDALAAMAGDGVELRIRGEAEVVADAEHAHARPRGAAMVANIAKAIVGYVHGCRSHRTLLQHPTRLNDAVATTDVAGGTGLRLLRFAITHVERSHEAAPGVDSGAAAADLARAAATARIDQMLAGEPIDQMSADELAAMAAAYVRFGDHAAARRVCELALDRDPTHERASMWLHEAMHQSGSPLVEQLELAGRCIERGVEPRVAWRLIRASILCRMATATDPATGSSRVVNRELYEKAADELRELAAGDSRLIERADASGWIDDWRSAFPGLSEEMAAGGA